MPYVVSDIYRNHIYIYIYNLTPFIRPSVELVSAFYGSYI